MPGVMLGPGDINMKIHVVLIIKEPLGSTGKPSHSKKVIVLVRFVWRTG